MCFLPLHACPHFESSKVPVDKVIKFPSIFVEGIFLIKMSTVILVISAISVIPYKNEFGNATLFPVASSFLPHGLYISDVAIHSGFGIFHLTKFCYISKCYIRGTRTQSCVNIPLAM